MEPVRLSRRAVLLGAPAILAGCGAESVVAPPEEVARAVYRHDGPPAFMLFTMINNRSDEGAHSGLLVNASQRVIFDGAGSFNHPQIPEVNDLFYGITPRALDFYIDYHSRITFRVRTNELIVTPEQAELAFRLLQEAGPVGPSFCNIVLTQVLREVPGFEDTPQSLFPLNTMRYFESRPGVRTAVYTDDSPDNRGDLVRVPLVR